LSLQTFATATNTPIKLEVGTQTLTSTYHCHTHDLSESVGGTSLGGLTETGVGTVKGCLVTCIDDITERK